MKQLTVLKSKIHRACVTKADLNYEGSITIDSKLLELADINEYEKVTVVNINNGERFDTYAIQGSTGEIQVNGAAARLVQAGDRIIIMCYCGIPAEFVRNHLPIIVLLDEHNKEQHAWTPSKY